MKTLKRRIYAMVYILAYLLFRHTHKTGKFSVSYVFFINTSYSRNCDSYFCFFIVALFLLLKKAPLPFNKSSEAKVWLFVIRVIGPYSISTRKVVAFIETMYLPGGSSVRTSA